MLRVRPGGLIFMAAQCSSWIWMSRSSSKRSPENVLGDVSRPFVQEGNALNNRCALLCLLSRQCGSHWVIEQPSSSLFFQTEDMRRVMQVTGAHLVRFNMSEFGHPTAKATLLAGTPCWLGSLNGYTSPNDEHTPSGPASSSSGNVHKAPKTKGNCNPSGLSLVIRKKKANGTVAVTGKRQDLKDSQVYPPRFALHVVRAHFPAMVEGVGSNVTSQPNSTPVDDDGGNMRGSSFLHTSACRCVVWSKHRFADVSCGGVF